MGSHVLYKRSLQGGCICFSGPSGMHHHYYMALRRICDVLDACMHALIRSPVWLHQGRVISDHCQCEVKQKLYPMHLLHVAYRHVSHRCIYGKQQKREALCSTSLYTQSQSRAELYKSQSRAGWPVSDLQDATVTPHQNSL